jgi:hypothetical protein
MRSKLIRSRLIAVALAAAVIAVASVTLAAASPATATDHTVTIQVVEHQVDAAAVDVGTPGPSLGDRFVVTGDLFQNGKKVGIDGGSFEFVRLKATTFVAQGVASATLPGGQLTIQGLAEFPTSNALPKPQTVAVTGGTSTYRNARGELRFVPINQTDTRLIFTLIL